MKRANERKPLVTHIYTADPSARVWGGKIYIFPSHDVEHDCPDDDDGDQYIMEDYHVLCMDNLDSECKDLGMVLHQDGVKWVRNQMWAPDAICKNGKYYLMFPAKDHDGCFRLGVAVADKPEGPYVPDDDYIQGSYSIDPGILTDDDGSVYVYYGGLWGGQLEMWQSGKFDPKTLRPAGKDKALGPMFAKMSEDMHSFATEPKMIQILDENGEPLLAEDEDRRFFEDSWIHKYQGKYYLSYSTGTTHYLVYAVSDKPEGPFTYQGRIMEPVLGWTTHHSILEIDGEWYIFYHDCELSGGVTHERCVKYTALSYTEDGHIKTIKPYEFD